MRSRLSWLLITGFVLLFAVACGGQAAPPPPPTSIPPTPIPNGGIEWLRLYFTNPDQAVQAVERAVLQDIRAAQRTIDLASFDLNLPSIVNALVEAKNRGVQVRIVYDGVNGSLVLRAADNNGTAFETAPILRQARINAVDGGRSNGLMHNKILLIDSTILYVGSWNTSFNDTFRNDNNVLRITSPTLIANYQAKFNEMFVDQRFGTASRIGALVPRFTENGTAVENYFSPRDEVMTKLVAEVNAARRSIRFIAFTYTHPALSEAMIARSRRGISVQGVIENRGASQGAMVPLACAGLPVRVDGNKNTMHHKVIVIDDTTVITGSYNFTRSADNSNDDNVLIIRNPNLAALYTQEFNRVYNLGRAPENVTCSGAPQCPNMNATCSELTCEQAFACLREGLERLDRDGNGIPCESKCGG